MKSIQKEIAERKAVIENLEKTILMAGVSIDSIRYFEETDMVRIRHTDGYAVCISAEGKSALALLYETLHELKPFLMGSLYKTGWHKSFGPSSSFNRERFLK